MIPELIEQARKLGYDYIIFAPVTKATYLAKVSQVSLSPNRDYIELRGGAILVRADFVEGVLGWNSIELDTATVTAPFELIRLPRQTPAVGVVALRERLERETGGVFN